MDFSDKLTLDGIKVTKDGYLTASVRAARTGIQEYAGSEVGKPDMNVVRVYRPEAEVFKKDALASFTSIPVTNDHPPEAVNADTWRKYAVGNTGEEVARDGESMRIPLIVKDAAAIRDIHDGKRELSCGYTCDLEWKSGVTDDGLPYDAIQTNIVGNHLAIVGRGRAGPEHRIGDSNVATKTITVDGIPVEVTDAAEAVINKMTAQHAKLAADLASANTTVGELTAKVSTKDGEILALKTQVADAEMTPAKLDAAVASRTKVIDAAKKIFPALVADGKTEAQIRKEAVVHKVADAASLDDAAISGAFAVLSSASATQIKDTLRAGIMDNKPIADMRTAAEDARKKALAETSEAWRNKTAN